MHVPPDLFDRAFGVWQAFGPEMRRPVEARWAESLPDLDPADYAAVAARIRAAEAVALDLAAAMIGGRLAEDEGRRRLRDAFPDLTDERLARTWNQARYFAWR